MNTNTASEKVTRTSQREADKNRLFNLGKDSSGNDRLLRFDEIKHPADFLTYLKIKEKETQERRAVTPGGIDNLVDSQREAEGKSNETDLDLGNEHSFADEDYEAARGEVMATQAESESTNEEDLAYDQALREYYVQDTNSEVVNESPAMAELRNSIQAEVQRLQSLPPEDQERMQNNYLISTAIEMLNFQDDQPFTEQDIKRIDDTVKLIKRQGRTLDDLQNAVTIKKIISHMKQMG